MSPIYWTAAGLEARLIEPLELQLPRNAWVRARHDTRPCEIHSLMTTDKPIRSIAKAASWRATGTVDTIVVSFFVTGHIRVALSIGAVEVFTKMLLYFLHERLWNVIPFGRHKQVDPDYMI